MAASITLDAAYNAFYNIKDLTVEHHRPVPYVMYSEETDVLQLYEAAVKELLTIGAPKITNLTTEELLDLPTYEYKAMVKLCKEYQENTNRSIAKATGGKGKQGGLPDNLLSELG